MKSTIYPRQRDKNRTWIERVLFGNCDSLLLQCWPEQVMETQLQGQSWQARLWTLDLVLVVAAPWETSYTSITLCEYAKGTDLHHTGTICAVAITRLEV